VRIGERPATNRVARAPKRPIRSRRDARFGVLGTLAQCVVSVDDQPGQQVVATRHVAVDGRGGMPSSRAIARRLNEGAPSLAKCRRGAARISPLISIAPVRAVRGAEEG